MSDDLTTAYMLGAEAMRSKLHKQADEIERLRAENETLRRDVKTAVMGDSAELQDVKRENERLRNNEKILLAAIADALRTTVWMSDVINGRWKHNKYNFDGELDVYKFALAAGKHDIRVPLLDAILELYGQETREKYQCHIDDVEGLATIGAAIRESGDE